MGTGPGLARLKSCIVPKVISRGGPVQGPYPCVGPPALEAASSESGTCKTVTAISAHVRQSRPDSGLGFQVNVLETFQGVLPWLGGSIDCVP